jgi:hypothetical protein
MLQLSRNATTNSNTVWIEASSFPSASIGLAFTSSYSGQTSTSFGTVVSRKLGYSGGWILFEIPGSQIPSDSGLYEVNIYNASVVAQATWGNYDKKWVDADVTFSDVSSNELEGNIVSSDLALISGSDYDPIVDYNYRDQAIFTVYNG